jgi:aspartate carbamoyltransferase catalytic subunit
MPNAAATDATDIERLIRERTFAFPHRHLLSISALNRPDAEALLDLADAFVLLNRQGEKKLTTLRGRTLINLFFESSTRTQSSFEIAAKRLGADTMNMAPRNSSITKGETLIDTAVTLNAMKPDILVVRHSASGAPDLLAQKVSCSVVNAGDGSREHPTQALLDALTLRQALGRIEGLVVAICGDVLHSRVARSNVALLQLLGAEVRLVGPPTLMPSGADKWGVTVHHDMKTGIAKADVVMMLRLQLERMDGAFVPSTREYFRYWGLDAEKLALASPRVRVMHPGPMNRGVEIDSDVADDPAVSLIQSQVEMGVAARMAVLASLAARLDGGARG